MTTANGVKDLINSSRSIRFTIIIIACLLIGIVDFLNTGDVMWAIGVSLITVVINSVIYTILDYFNRQYLRRTRLFACIASVIATWLIVIFLIFPVFIGTFIVRSWGKSPISSLLLLALSLIIFLATVGAIGFLGYIFLRDHPTPLATMRRFMRKHWLISKVRSRNPHVAIGAIDEIAQRDWLKGERGILQKIDLTHVDLPRAKLNEANLYETDLQNARMIGAILSKATMSRANLKSANLSGASLRLANLDNATLDNANLIGANLSGASLIGATLDGAQFSASDASSSTTLPDGSTWTKDTDLSQFTSATQAQDSE